ncbi:putative RNA polymerase sigma 70 factor [Psychrobacillus phage PVJ1]|nr:putative RNA polymerase sigma 70 factor [Psychrobacillus phage PVJ1]
MTPTERKKLNENRLKLKGYRNRLMFLKDVIPNINELWDDNEKIMEFFESGKAAKFEGNATIKPSKQTEKVRKTQKVKKELTVEMFLDLKAKGLSDRKIMAEFGMHSNKLTNWKKANGLVGLSKAAYQEKLDKGESKMATVMAEVKVDGDKEVQSLLQEAKSKIEALENEKTKALELAYEREKQLQASNLKIQQLEASLEESKGNVSKYIERSEIANKAERKAIEELIAYQSDYRNLEVDYRNQSGELARVKGMLERLKYTSQINVWLMKQHVGFVEQADEMAEVFGR